MKHLSIPRVGLCLLMSLQLGLPVGTWADIENRDFQVQELVPALREKTTLWVLSIGVSDYQDERIQLRYADHDAMKIAQVMKTQVGRLFREVFVHVLVNEQATRDGILSAMSRFLGQASGDDVVLIFLAGHGLRDRQTGTYYFLPYNANAENLIFAGLSMATFDETCRRLQGNISKLVLWLDTCHAGAFRVGARGIKKGEDLSEALAQAEGQFLLSASKAGEESYEDEKFRLRGEDQAHGAFTYSILRGFTGEAADEDGVVWISDLFSHVDMEVPRLTMGQQHPHGQILGTNLPIFIVNDQTAEAIAQPFSADSSSMPPLGSSEYRQGGRRWLWWLLGATAVGGSAIIISTTKGGKQEPRTGRVDVEVKVP
jgi:uncharacterized caspase-like protein